MRERLIEIKYIELEEFIKLEPPLMKRKIILGSYIYGLILNAQILRNSEDLIEMFYPQRHEINNLWIPGESSIGDAKTCFELFSYTPDYYNHIFETAIKREDGRLVVKYKSEKTALRAGTEIKLRDDFTFTKSDSGLVLLRFSIIRDNYSRYLFSPPIPSSKQARGKLLGIRSDR